MDSLTQIVLGAACGEAILGKKIGNRALLFGAIGGTIPDLDVFVGSWLYDNAIQAMAFHRGFMHSIWFALLGSFGFGWLTFKLYNTQKRKHTTGLKDWIWLYFWALFTHPILDCFTPYGTQLFAPFSDYRVAFNTISVVDPLYTVPFLMSLIVLMFQKRSNNKRRLWLKIGIGLSSAYLLFTCVNYFNIRQVYKNSLEIGSIPFKRFQIQPTLLNNVLWYGIAEGESVYYVGFYSLLDNEKRVKDWIEIPKHRQGIVVDDENLQRLVWFSNGYYNIIGAEQTGMFTFQDLRYPLSDPKDSNSFIFSFPIYESKGTWDMENSGPRFESEGEPVSISEFFTPMIERLKGI